MIDFIKLFKKLHGCKEDELIKELDSCKLENTEMKSQNDALKRLLTDTDYRQPESYGTITYDNVSRILNPLTTNWKISDKYFQKTKVEEAKKFCERSKVQTKSWIAENHDCDNFSFALNGYWSEGLKSFAFGIAWSTTHAFNFMIDDTEKLWIVEPQTNRWMTVEEAKEMKGGLYYPVRMMLL